MALTEFYHADAETKFHPLPVSSYFISSLWMYLCSCKHIMSTLWSITEAVNSGSWPILFKVLTLNVGIYIVLLHLSNFCFCLCSVANFSNNGARALTSAGCTSFLPARRAMLFGHVVWVRVMVIFRWLCFILIHRRYSKRWVTVVLRLNYLILPVVPWGLFAQHWWGALLTRRCIHPS